MSAAAAEARERGCRYLVSLSAGPATRLQSLRAGWRDLGEITTLQRTSPAAQVRRLLHEKLAEHRAPSRPGRTRAASGVATHGGRRSTGVRSIQAARACARSDAIGRGAEPQRFGAAAAGGHGQPDRAPPSARRGAQCLRCPLSRVAVRQPALQLPVRLLRCVDSRGFRRAGDAGRSRTRPGPNRPLGGAGRGPEVALAPHSSSRRGSSST